MDYVTLGYNWRISNITATLGISQLEKLAKVTEMRRRNAAYMSGKLLKVDAIEVPYAEEGFFHVYQMYTVKVRSGEKARDNLKNRLADNGVMTKVYFSPVHLTSFYREQFGFQGGELPVTENISGHVLTLPMYPSLTMDEMDYIADNIKDFVENMGNE